MTVTEHGPARGTARPLSSVPPSSAPPATRRTALGRTGDNVLAADLRSQLESFLEDAPLAEQRLLNEAFYLSEDGDGARRRGLSLAMAQLLSTPPTDGSSALAEQSAAALLDLHHEEGRLRRLDWHMMLLMGSCLSLSAISRDAAARYLARDYPDLLVAMLEEAEREDLRATAPAGATEPSSGAMGAEVEELIAEAMDDPGPES